MTTDDLFDFSEMHFSPHCRGRIVDEYPELKMYEEFMDIPEHSCLSMECDHETPEKALDNLVKFCFAFAGRKSPLFRIKDMKERRRLAETIAGCGDNSRISIELKDEAYQRVLHRVFKVECGYELQEYISKVEMMHNWMKVLRVDSSEDPAIIAKQVSLVKEIPLLRADIEAIESALFADKSATQEYVIARDATELVGYAERQAKKYARDAIF
jgi:hypothetical protein